MRSKRLLVVTLCFFVRFKLGTFVLQTLPLLINGWCWRVLGRIVSRHLTNCKKNKADQEL